MEVFGINLIDVVLWISAFALIVVGFAGTIVPALPGLPMIAAASWLIAIVDDYQRIGGWTIAWLAFLAVVGTLVDSVAQTAGAQKAGATKGGIIGSLIGSLLGMFFGLAGIFLFPFIGAVIGELIVMRDVKFAGRVGVATWIGIIAGTALKISLAFTMVLWMFFVYFFG